MKRRPLQDPLIIAGHEVTEKELTLDGKSYWYCWHLKDLPGDRHLVVYEMLVNWRLAEASDDWWEFRRGYCYEGKSILTLLRAIVAGLDWDGSEDSDPVGWVKETWGGRHPETEWDPSWFDAAVARLYAANGHSPSPCSSISPSRS